MRHQHHHVLPIFIPDRELSPLEKRRHLYRQEINIEKMCRTQDESRTILAEIAEIKRVEISNILAVNREYLQNNNQLVEYIGNEVGGGIYELGRGLNSISDKIELSYKMSQDGFNNILRGLGIVNENISHGHGTITTVIDEGVNNIVESISVLSHITTNVLLSLEDIDHKLGNPKKTAGLELKRDAFQFYKNGWYEESLRTLGDTIQYLCTDYDSYYLQGIIYLEENEDYTKAKESFGKAIRYSKPNNQQICAAALYKLAVTYFIEGDFEKAFVAQLDGLNYGDSIIYWMNLARCTAHLNKQDVFEDAVYRTLIGDKLNIIKFTTEKDFIDQQWKVEVVTKALDIIQQGKIKPFSGTVAEIVDRKVNSKNESGEYPIHEAIKNKNIEKVKELLMSGADINLGDDSGMTPLHLAVSVYGTNVTLVNLLLKFKTNVNSRDKQGNNALHFLFQEDLWGRGCNDNTFESIRLLIKAGIQLNDRNNEGDTVLHRAIKADPEWGEGHINYRTIGFLINSGADLHAKLKSGESPIQFVIKNKYSELIKLLIKLGVNLKELDEENNSLLHVVCSEKDQHNWLIPILLDAGVQVNAKNSDGATPISLAVNANKSIEVIKLLIKGGADVNNKTGIALLDKSINDIIYNYIDVDFIKLLVQSKVDLNAIDRDGVPFITKIFNYYKSLCDVERTDHKHLLKYNSDIIELFKFFIEMGANIDVEYINIHKNIDYRHTSRSLLYEFFLEGHRNYYHIKRGGNPYDMNIFLAMLQKNKQYCKPIDIKAFERMKQGRILDADMDSPWGMAEWWQIYKNNNRGDISGVKAEFQIGDDLYNQIDRLLK